MEKQMLSPKEVSNAYGIKTGTLANMRCQRRGPKFFKVGGRMIRYRIEDIERWVKRNPVLTIDSVEE